MFQWWVARFMSWQAWEMGIQSVISDLSFSKMEEKKKKKKSPAVCIPLHPDNWLSGCFIAPAGLPYLLFQYFSHGVSMGTSLSQYLCPYVFSWSLQTSPGSPSAWQAKNGTVHGQHITAFRPEPEWIQINICFGRSTNESIGSISISNINIYYVGWWLFSGLRASYPFSNPG